MVKIDINIGSVASQGISSKPKIHLNAATILRYLIGDDEKVNDLIVLGAGGKDLMTTDKEMHEALGSITKYDAFKPTKLAKLFEMADIYPYRDLTHQPKPVLTFEKMEEIRKEALKQEQKGLPPQGSGQEKPGKKPKQEK